MTRLAGCRHKAVSGMVAQCVGIASLICSAAIAASPAAPLIPLPAPALAGAVSVEQALAQRRSVRDFHAGPLSQTELGQLLWAAQGITHPRGLRTAPSAGALYPLEVYLVAGEVEGLAAAVYHYRPDGHGLAKIADGDRRRPLSRAAHLQSWIRDAGVVIVLAAEFKRTTRKYGKRGTRYVHMEVGHAAENLLLQAAVLGLGAVPVGAFADREVAEVVALPDKIEPLMLLPVGRKQ